MSTTQNTPTTPVPQIGDELVLQAQIDGDCAGDRIRVTGIESVADYPGLCDADRAYFAKLGPTIHYVLVFDSARDAMVHREWGGSMESASYLTHLRPVSA